MRVQLSGGRRREDGAVAVLVSVLSLVIFVVAGFTVDFGMAYAQRQAMAAGVDSAALAVVRSYYETELTEARTCPAILADDAALAAGDPAKASTIALDEVNANAPFGSTFTGSDLTTSLDCIGKHDAVLEVTVTASRNVATTFGRIAGVQTLGVNRAATAGLGVANEVTGLLPLGICTFQAQQIVADAMADKAAGQPYRAELVALTKIWSGANACDGSGGSGNWGWLDLGQGNSESALGNMLAAGGSTETWTLGEAGTLSLDGTPGNKGNGAPVHSGMGTLLDQVVTLPVYDTYQESGANASYEVSGFLVAKICAYDDKHGACYDTGVPTGSNELQLRFAGFAPLGDLDDACAIGLACANLSYVTRLQR